MTPSVCKGSRPWAGFFFVVESLLVSCVLWGAEVPRPSVVLEDFERYGSSSFPSKWRGQEDSAPKIYRIETETGNRFLHAHADKQAVHIGLEHVFDPLNYRLRWRWRVLQLPTGADERDAALHDAAAQVYVVFDNQYWPRVIKYIWSSSLPVGTRFNNPLYSRGRIVIKRSGASNMNKWLEEEAILFEDYKKFFGDAPGKVQGIGILTSSDSTKSIAVADYDDFVLLP